jgi:hypothetical protein
LDEDTEPDPAGIPLDRIIASPREYGIGNRGSPTLRPNHAPVMASDLRFRSAIGPGFRSLLRTAWVIAM